MLIEGTVTSGHMPFVQVERRRGVCRHVEDDREFASCTVSRMPASDRVSANAIVAGNLLMLQLGATNLTILCHGILPLELFHDDREAPARSLGGQTAFIMYTMWLRRVSC